MLDVSFTDAAPDFGGIGLFEIHADQVGGMFKFDPVFPAQFRQLQA